MVKDLPANTGDTEDTGSILGSERSSGEGDWQPTPVFLPGEFHGQRSQAGYSPWGQKEWDSIEHMCTQTCSLKHSGM